MQSDEPMRKKRRSAHNPNTAKAKRERRLAVGNLDTHGKRKKKR